MLNGKEESRLEMELSLPIKCLQNRKIILDYLSGSNIITRALKSIEQRRGCWRESTYEKDLAYDSWLEERKAMKV